MPHDVFVSYATEDAAKADEVVRALEAAGIHCWIAGRDILPGTNWAAEIEQAIRQSRVMVLVVSPDFNRSVHTPKEIILGIDQKLHIVPIRTVGFQPWGHLRYFLADEQWLDASAEKLEERLNLITQVVRHYLARGSARNSQPDGTQPAKALGILPLGPLLKLEMWPPMKLGKDPSVWLQAWNALVPLTGRESDIEDLFQMIRAEGAFRWRVLFGEAGIGKTRIAIEFARQAMSEGWHAGFLSGDDLRRFVSADLVGAWRPCVPTLIIVDYAASKVADLRPLFKHLSAIEAEAAQDTDAAAAVPPVRVLLLERHADEARGWLNTLRAGGEGATRVYLRDVCYRGLKKLQPPGGKNPTGATAVNLTRKIIANTFERWAAIKGLPAPPLPDFTEKDWRAIQLRTDNRPLYLQMAALHACERGSAVELPAWGRGELLRSAVERERLYVETTCGANTPLCKAVAHITAILCLAGRGAAHDGRQWIQTVANELAAKGLGTLSVDTVEDQRKAIFTEAETGFSDVEAGIIQPDMVSEGFAAQVLREEDGGPPVETLKQVLRVSEKAWPNLVRMVQDLVGIERHLFPRHKKPGDEIPEIESIDSWLPPLLADRPMEELRKLTAVIPERSISLHRFALLVNEHLLSCIPADHIAERAECLLSLATHRIFQSRATRETHEQAIQELQEAVRLFSQLPLDDGKCGCRLQLARAYRRLENASSILREYEGAVRYILIAARLAGGDSYEDSTSSDASAKVDAASFRMPEGQEAMLEFANCLNNLGTNLKALKRTSEELSVLLRAVDVGEHLIAHNAQRYEPDLARYLNNLSLAQSAGNDLAGAILSSRRSARIRAEFALTNPDEFATPLSLTLRNLVAFEYSQKNVAGAQEATEQLIAIYDDLSARDPGSYRAELAQCYHNIGYLCDDTGNKAEGIRYTLEGLKIREELLESDFDYYALPLAWSHNNAGNMYHDIGDLAHAHPYLERAYALRLKWVESAPGRQLPELTKSADLMAKLCRDENDAEGEAVWLERTVRYAREIELPAGEGAMAEYSLAEALRRLGRTAEANVAAISSAQGFRKLFDASSSETDFTNWVEAGCNLSSALAFQGDWIDDGGALAQAIEVARQVLARLDPEKKAFSYLWGALMTNLGHAEYRQGELLGQIDGVRQGIESLQTALQHHIKHRNKSASDEPSQLLARAYEALANLQGTSNPGEKSLSTAGGT